MVLITCQFHIILDINMYVLLHIYSQLDLCKQQNYSHYSYLFILESLLFNYDK